MKRPREDDSGPGSPPWRSRPAPSGARVGRENLLCWTGGVPGTRVSPNWDLALGNPGPGRCGNTGGSDWGRGTPESWAAPRRFRDSEGASLRREGLVPGEGLPACNGRIPHLQPLARGHGRVYGREGGARSSASWLEAGPLSPKILGQRTQPGPEEFSHPARPATGDPRPQLQDLSSSSSADHSLPQAAPPQLPRSSTPLAITHSSIAAASQMVRPQLGLSGTGLL